MKINLRRILALAIFISVAALNISARTDGGPDRKLSRKERKENDMAKVDKMLSDTVYVVDVTTALPTGWKSVRLSSGYSVEIERTMWSRHFLISDVPIRFHTEVVKDCRLKESPLIT